MALFGLPKGDRRTVAEGLIAWGNLVFAALVLSHTGLLGERPDTMITVAGIVLWLVAYTLAILVMRGGE